MKELYARKLVEFVQMGELDNAVTMMNAIDWKYYRYDSKEEGKLVPVTAALAFDMILGLLSRIDDYAAKDPEFDHVSSGGFEVRLDGSIRFVGAEVYGERGEA